MAIELRKRLMKLKQTSIIDLGWVPIILGLVMHPAVDWLPQLIFDGGDNFLPLIPKFFANVVYLVEAM